MVYLDPIILSPGKVIPRFRIHFKSKILLSFDLIIPDKKTACALLAGSLKYLQHSTLLGCDIECCNGSYCNDGGKVYQ